MNKRENIKYCTIIVFVFVFSFSGLAQKNIQYSQYMFNHMQYNPAYAGTRDAISGSLQYNAQWVGFDGAPRTQALNIHSPMKLTNVGLGLTVVNESVAVTHNTDIMAVYAYRIPFSKGKLSLGVHGGVLLRNENFSELTTTGLGDENYINDVKATSYNVGFGMFYYTDNFYLGFSIPKLIDNKFDYIAGGDKSSFDPLANPYYFTTGFVSNVNESLKLKPSILFKHLLGNPVTVDVSLNALIKETVGIGAFYRFNSSFGVMAEIFVLKRIMLAYAYSVALNDVKTYNDGTHEIMINFDIVRKKVSYQSPRYF